MHDLWANAEMHSTVMNQIKFHWLLVHFLHCRCLSGHQHSTLEGLRVQPVKICCATGEISETWCSIAQFLMDASSPNNGHCVI